MRSFFLLPLPSNAEKTPVPMCGRGVTAPNHDRNPAPTSFRRADARDPVCRRHRAADPHLHGGSAALRRLLPGRRCGDDGRRRFLGAARRRQLLLLPLHGRCSRRTGVPCRGARRARDVRHELPVRRGAAGALAAGPSGSLAPPTGLSDGPFPAFFFSDSCRADDSVRSTPY